MNELMYAYVCMHDHVYAAINLPAYTSSTKCSHIGAVTEAVVIFTDLRLLYALSIVHGWWVIVMSCWLACTVSLDDAECRLYNDKVANI
jgi:hypothetical protein